MNSQVNRQVVVSDDLNVTEVDGETVILDRASDQIHTLNPTASFIWILLGKNSDMNTITQQFMDEYAISRETAVVDLNSILEELLELGLIQQQ